MKAVFFFALFACAAADLCRKGDAEEIRKIKAIARSGASLILGSSCPALAGNIDAIIFSKKCKALARQAMCYGLRASERYGDSDVISYGQLSGDIPNIAELGELTCRDAEKCFKQVSKEVKKCIASNPNFIQDTVAAAELAYELKAEEAVQNFVDSSSNTLFGELANLALGKFESAADIKTFIDEYVSSALKGKVASDAAAAAKEAKQIAKEWCSSGCTGQSGDFVESLFNGMHGGQCVDASQFCGPCQENAHAHFANGNSIPCCMDAVIQKGIAAYEYVAEAYGDQVGEWVGLVSDELSSAANDKAKEYKDAVLEQASCIGNAYSDHKPSCA